MKNKIFITSRFLTQPITGVQRYGIELSKAIKKINENFDLNFIAPKNILHKKIAKELEVKKIGNLKGQLWDQLSLLNFLKQKNNPLIINFSNTLPIFYTNKIVTIHDIINLKYDVNWKYKKYYEIVWPLMLKNSKHIITVSEFSKKEISDYFNINPNKISVIYNGVNETFKPKKIRQKEKYILGLSSIAKHKNFERLIQAFLKIDTNVKLYIVGGINPKIFGKSTLKILDKIQESKNIVFLGRVDDDKLIELYSNALFFVYPSLYEGFGIPPLEAQACGCSVLLSDIPVFKEVYGNSVHYCNPLDENDIKIQIEYLLNNQQFLDKLKNKSLENVKKYTWEKSAEIFLRILKECNE